MADFLDDISVYNAKAAAAISLAVTQGNSPKANLMSSLKTTANDITLTDDVRLEALTALINIGSLLDIPLPPYFPVATSYADSQTYVGVHNDLSGLNVGDYQHLSAAEKAAALNKASLTDISFANLIGVYTDNASLVSGFATKQNALNGTGYVKASGGTITYDNSTFLTTITGIVAAATPGGGQITGTYASPVISNAAVIAKVLTGFNGSAPTGTITSSDSILSAIEKLNANVDNVIATSGTINNITFALPSAVFSYTAGPFTSGSAPLSATFVNQAQNRFFAGPSSGGSGQPSFRAIVAGDFPVSGATAGTYGSSTTVPQITVDAYGRVTGITNVTSATGGQVNTITYSVPAGVFNSSVTGTSAVSITLGLLAQTANYVWAGPVSGAAAGPTFRALVAADIPSGLPISTISGLQNALDSKMNYSLNDGEIFIGSIANAPAMKTLGGDITMTREGFVTIAGESVTFSKMQEITSGTLLGRWGTIDPGPVQEVGLSADFVLDSGTGILSLAVPVAPILDTKGSLITYTSATGTQVQLYAGTNGQILIPNNTLDEGLEWVSMSGDVELDTTTPSGAATITPGAVTLAKMADLPTDTIIGNNAALGTPLALSVTDVTLMLDEFTTSTKGLVPAPGALGATYFLNANGGWTVPAGGGGSGTVTSVSVVSANGFAGTVATATTTPAITLSTTVTGLLKGNGTSISAATAGTDYLVGTVSLANGGTNASNTAVNGGVAYSTASAINITAAGTAGQILKSNGAAAPTWTTATYPSTTVKDKILVSTANNVVGEIDAPTSNDTFLKWNAGVFSWAAAGSGSGTVSSGNQYQLAYYAGAGATTTVSGLTSITASRALVSDANGLPIASTVSTTQLQYLASATGTTGTTSTNLVFSTSPVLVTPTIGVATGTSLDVSGALTSGVASTTPGTLVLRNAASAFTQTIRGTNYGSSIIYDWPTGTPTAGQLLSASAPSAGVITLSWASAGAASISIGSTVTSGTTGSVLFVGSGPVLSQSNANFFWDNTNSRLGLTTTSPTGILHINSTNVTATIPHLLLAATTTTPTGSVGGSLWYYASGTTEYLGLYKSNAALVTKLITKDKNPDFVTTGSGILVSDANGTLTKSAELTALGVYSAYADVTNNTTTITSLISGSIVGSTTLPANFFAVGKTMRVLLVGTITCANGDDSTITLSIGSATQTFSVTDLPTCSTSGFVMELFYVCRVAGASASVSVTGSFTIANTNPQNAHVYVFPTVAIATFNSAASQSFNIQNTWAQSGSTVVVQTNTAYYLN